MKYFKANELVLEIKRVQAYYNMSIKKVIYEMKQVQRKQDLNLCKVIAAHTDGRQRERHKTIEQKNKGSPLHMRYKFWHISLPYATKQQREMTKFKVWWRT